MRENKDFNHFFTESGLELFNRYLNRLSSIATKYQVNDENLSSAKNFLFLFIESFMIDNKFTLLNDSTVNKLLKQLNGPLFGPSQLLHDFGFINYCSKCKKNFSHEVKYCNLCDRSFWKHNKQNLTSSNSKKILIAFLFTFVCFINYGLGFIFYFISLSSFTKDVSFSSFNNLLNDFKSFFAINSFCIFFGIISFKNINNPDVPEHYISQSIEISLFIFLSSLIYLFISSRQYDISSYFSFHKEHKKIFKHYKITSIGLFSLFFLIIIIFHFLSPSLSSEELFVELLPFTSFLFFALGFSNFFTLLPFIKNQIHET